MQRSPPSIVVIGAGLVGLCTALTLQGRGQRVHLIDPAQPGSGASQGNPGGLSVTSIFPMAVPGIHRKVPGWLLDPLGPLAIRWSHLPALVPWLIRFLKAANPAQVAEGVAGLFALTGGAVDGYTMLAARAHAASLIRADGHLMVYRSAAAMAREDGAWKRRADLNIAFDTLDADTLRQMEPELDPAFVCGRFVPGNAQCTDPLRLALDFARALQRDGGIVSRTAATGFDIADGLVRAVRTDSGMIQASHVVLCAGAHSAPLARQLGNRVALEPERGYHAQITACDVVLQRPVFSTEAKVFAASMVEGLRFAGTAEFAGAGAAPDWRRADGLLSLGKLLFPRIADNHQTVTRWMGLRPSTPDGLPVLGRAAAARNAILAFGHGHIGVTSAPMTARVVEALILGETPPIPMSPYRPERFQRGA
ncbi:NAD(P)/FAD-dependent oxidoreductase [Robbsia andropogonis]|uniref:NAD(P)/FAD-dependent oxidoreductase n=1 Tax=Robbsia andropogonis TaxID=28092 RepID=UPI0004633B48|nr:FAD-binding oxidoreductase [Robbsia andropogonis]MCP1120914.1 FAD-binding oxidoreductase [Robbsia andropogonis]MCP1130712.1 FAD-binding oxidoreductase [Robbsia andropogonis]